MADPKLTELPDELFTIIQQATTRLGPRLGRLSIPGRHAVETPHYLAITSRGAVPHITQDTFSRSTGITSAYVGLEDFVEKYPFDIPPLFKYPKPEDGASSLRRFIALPHQTLLVLGARRTPPVAAPAANPNTNTKVCVMTAVGFRSLEVGDYAEAAEELKPDILVAVGDMPYGRTLGRKRIEKATDRQIQWLHDHAKLRTANRAGDAVEPQAKLFVPLLPVSCSHQQYFIDCLAEDDVKAEVSGLAIYDLDTLVDLPQELAHLPRLAFTTPDTPHDILRQVALGVDMLALPSITNATDAGIAFDFSLAGSNPSNFKQPLPLGINLWSSSHATELSPLSEGCSCYACTNHHRAYLHHLLNAKEMLAWVLLQIHNHRTIDVFFDEIRNSIRLGSFEQDTQRFAGRYERVFPESTGKGPRVRGYQLKSEGPGEAKKNKAPFKVLANGRSKEASVLDTTKKHGASSDARMLNEGKEVIADSTLTSRDIDAEGLERLGFAERED
ncbi:tRNA-guanine transglycosylase family protein [Teratosphaeria destructans]|uniref:Queuine tRNA-ribosyltransferase accessory subunit 2 n=1 Tax=Teratosphaeria destructans TaxID=418781 RepID=A0A9W7W3R3_9PEZI|nr:tRNA-guanine transglycosylase family protein [Teratosphaeria destructans]